MKLYAECVACLARTSLERAKPVRDPALRTEYMRRVCEILGDADPRHDSAPLLDARIARLRREFLGVTEDYAQIKRDFNARMLNIYDALRDRVRAAADPLLAALQFSIVGNYIDFNLLGDIDPEEALRLIDEAAGRELNPAELANLRADLARGGELMFVHDNCGEVVLDKLLIETIRWLYPSVRAISLVRGGPVANDATREDAAQIGLGDVAEVLDNGAPDLPGTQIDELPPGVRARLERAAVVIAKGQGNFESMIGCGLNVYYLLLSKCVHYTEWFGFAHMGGVLANERRRSF